MTFFFHLASWVFGDALVRPLRLLSGGTVVQLGKRLGRLRRIAASMFHASLQPPMPVRLQIETTDSCNLKCRMCTRELLVGMNKKNMPLDKFQNIVAEISPYYVTLNGLGEPLIDRTIFEKLSWLHERRIMTSMPTNGTYVRRRNLQELARNLPDMLHFSLDGATKESFEYIRVDGDFEQIVGNYRALLELRKAGKARPGTKIAILCALQKENLFDFRDMFKLVRSMRGLDAFDLVPVFDYDQDGSSFACLIPTPEDVREVQRQIDWVIAASNDESEKAFYERWKRISEVWLDPPAASVAPDCASHSCLIPWYSTYIDAKGRVYPCCYLTNSTHVMGNIYGQSFDEIWYGEIYRKFRKQLVVDRRHLEGCRSCPRNDDNRLSQLKYLGPILTKPASRAIETSASLKQKWVMRAHRAVGRSLFRLRRTRALRWLWRIAITVPVSWKSTKHVLYVDLLRNFRLVADRTQMIEDRERKSFTLLIERLRPRIFWDIGSNVGMYTVEFLSRVPNGSVVAFEPDRRNVDLLARTVRKNCFGAVEIVSQAVGAHNGEAEFLLDDITGATGTLDPAQVFITTQYGQTPNTTNVKVTTLDNEARHRPVPDIIKIDVEGAELAVMTGGREMFTQYLPAVIYEASLRNFSETRKFLEALGYRLFDATTFRPIDEPTNNVIALHETKHLNGQEALQATARPLDLAILSDSA